VGEKSKICFFYLRNMAKRDEEAAVEAMTVDRLIELWTTYTWIHQQKVGAVDRCMEYCRQ